MRIPVSREAGRRGEEQMIAAVRWLLLPPQRQPRPSDERQRRLLPLHDADDGGDDVDGDPDWQ